MIFVVKRTETEVSTSSSQDSDNDKCPFYSMGIIWQAVTVIRLLMSIVRPAASYETTTFQCPEGHYLSTFNTAYVGNERYYKFACSAFSNIHMVPFLGTLKSPYTISLWIFELFRLACNIRCETMLGTMPLLQRLI